MAVQVVSSATFISMMLEHCHFACFALEAASSFFLRKGMFYYLRGLLTLTRSGFILKAGKSSPRHHIKRRSVSIELAL
ncbi:hypothetical protein [Bacillus subtilis]|uniref:hypothetical protein n=1 Tax=Bacillus subtilis TaxID=1423 RepID=UPI003EBFF133